MGNAASRCVREVQDVFRSCRSGRSDDDVKVLYTFPKEDLEKYKIRTAPNNVADTQDGNIAARDSIPDYSRIQFRKENLDSFRIDPNQIQKGQEYGHNVRPVARTGKDVNVDCRELNTRRSFQGEFVTVEEDIHLIPVHLKQSACENRVRFEKDLMIAKRNFERLHNGKQYHKNFRVSDPCRRTCDVGIQVGGLEKCRRKSSSFIKYADCCAVPKVTNKHEEDFSLFDDLEEKVSGDPVSVLEHRQEDLLQRLVQLQQSVQKLSQQYGVPVSTPASSGAPAVGVSSTPSPIQPGVFHDIVIQADPQSPPLSLLVLYQRLTETYKVLASTFIHSSATLDVPDNLKDVFKNGQSVPRREAQVCLTLIWKKVKRGPILMVNTAKQSPIFGEANIARYIERILNPAYDSADIVTATQTDEWLDMADLQVVNGNNKERGAVARALNSRLGRNDWLVGSSLSLADTVMWSALNQSGQASEVPANVKKWLKSCNENSMFKQALSALG